MKLSFDNPIGYLSAFVPLATSVPASLRATVISVSVFPVTSYPLIECSSPSYFTVDVLPVTVTVFSVSSGVISTVPLPYQVT